LILPALRRRRGRPLFLIDIAVPRDIDPEVASLDNVFLYDVDDLESVVEDMAKERAGEADHVEEIVAEETGKFMAWWKSLNSAPLVTQLKNKHESIRRAELTRLRNQLPELPEDVWNRIETATRSMINRVTRDPIDRLKSAAANGASTPPESILDAARDLFALSEDAEERRSQE
jgi:glutamyl-tRNA reductase